MRPGAGPVARGNDAWVSVERLLVDSLNGCLPPDPSGGKGASEAPGTQAPATALPDAAAGFSDSG